MAIMKDTKHFFVILENHISSNRELSSNNGAT